MDRSPSLRRQAETRGVWPQFSGNSESRSGFAGRQLALFFLFALLVIALRGPDRFLHAQFWAEDGATWYADAYNKGWWAPFFSPVAGYFVTLPRLAGDLALLAPFRLTPLLMNVIGASVNALPFVFLLSGGAAAWGPLPLRAAMAAYYLLLPNSWTIHVTVTNAQWSLTLLALLMLLADPPTTKWQSFAYFLVLLLCGFTGPYCFVLLPIAVWRWQKDRGYLAFCAVLAAACIAQGISLLQRGGVRHTAPLGATLGRFIRILAGQVYLGAIFGVNSACLNMRPILLVSVAAVGTAFVVWCAIHTTWQLRIVILFGAAMLAAGLASPYGLDVRVPAWQSLLTDRGSRYWFFPEIAFGWSVVWMAANARSVPLRAASLAVLCAVSFGIIRDFHDPVFQDLHFALYADQFEKAPKGMTVVIPLDPFPQLWQARLRKK